MLFLGARMISNVWLQIPEAEMTLVALSPAIFFVAISSVMRGYFNGRQNIKATARSQTLEQLFKTMLTIIIVEVVAIISNASTKWMAGGATLATTLATFVGFGYLYLYYKTRRKEIALEVKSTVNYKYERVKTIIKRILLVSIPISLTAIMSSLNKNIDSFTVVRSLKQFMPEDMAISQYGILGGKVDMLTSLPLSINVAFATALVPAISAAKAKKDNETITKRTSFSLLTSMLIGLPCTVRNVYICRTNIKFAISQCKCRRNNIANKLTYNNIYNFRSNDKWCIARLWKIDDTNNFIRVSELF